MNVKLKIFGVNHISLIENCVLMWRGEAKITDDANVFLMIEKYRSAMEYNAIFLIHEK